ncbi:unnamed protein product [Lactuca saligna]|uniref:Uncharacterized protein n=1 Tax=Lactuca saligna TaxID=75948 RepID=A0AA36E038_LACSI|nr:unnamed protein product [Lactuca saligna]
MGEGPIYRLEGAGYIIDSDMKMSPKAYTDTDIIQRIIQSSIHINIQLSNTIHHQDNPTHYSELYPKYPHKYSIIQHNPSSRQSNALIRLHSCIGDLIFARRSEIDLIWVQYSIMMESSITILHNLSSSSIDLASLLS